MSEPTDTSTLDPVSRAFLEAGITTALEQTLQRLDRDLRILEVLHAYRWVNVELDTRERPQAILEDGSVAVPAFDFAYTPEPGLAFVFCLFPDTGDEQRDRKIPVRMVPVGIVSTKIRRKAEELLGGSVEIPVPSEKEWNEEILDRRDIMLEVTFEEREIKGRKRIVARAPSGKRVELFHGGKTGRGASKKPPLGKPVRVRVVKEQFSRHLVTWTGLTTEQAVEQETRLAAVQQVFIGTGRVAARRKFEIDPFVGLGLDPATATVPQTRDTARELYEREFPSQAKADEDPMVVAMITTGDKFAFNDPADVKVRFEYLDAAREAAITAIRRRDQAKAREARKPADQPAQTEAPAEAGAAPSNGTSRKPWNSRTRRDQLLAFAAEHGVEVPEGANPREIRTALDAKWAAKSHPQA